MNVIETALDVGFVVQPRFESANGCRLLMNLSKIGSCLFVQIEDAVVINVAIDTSRPWSKV
jgi:hypothetical protein